MSRGALIFLLTLCLMTSVPGLCDEVLSSSHDSAEIAAGTLTNIAACLDHARNHPNTPASVKLAAGITLVDPERKLVVLQDQSGAMGIYSTSFDPALKSGQRVQIEGSGVFPYARAYPKYPDEPSSRDILSSFEAPVGRGTYFLSRIRGYLHPPVTGEYTFSISADDEGEFFLSPDASPERRERIATNQIGNATGPENGNASPRSIQNPLRSVPAKRITWKPWKCRVMGEITLPSLGKDRELNAPLSTAAI